MSPTWSPIGNPNLVNIPYFAMTAAGAKCSAAYPITGLETLQTELGDLAADWLHGNEGKQFLGFYTTREYVMPKTARYQNWLVFEPHRDCRRLFGLSHAATGSLSCIA